MISAGDLASPVHVFLVDDHMVVRRGIRFMLSALQDIELVGEAGSGEEAMAICPPLRPDVILVDLKLPGQDGVATIRALKEALPNMHVVVLTSSDDPRSLRDALQAGATSYLLKNASADELAEAIRQAHQGLTTVSPDLIQMLVAYTTSAHQRSVSLGTDLSDRERQVLALLVKGLSNKRIAEQLVVEPATIKYHTQRLRAKLRASTRTELVALALQYHIIEPTVE